MDELIRYNLHDVYETERFTGFCKHLIEMRKDLLDTGVLTGDVLNYSDVKIGTEYLIKKIGRNKCFSSGSTPRQTFRESVNFNEIILPTISYRTESFQAVLEWFKKQIIYTNSEAPKPKLEAYLAGLQFFFGVGGVHASVDSKVFHANNKYKIIDVDVTGMYPSIAIANRFAPEHLGDYFSVAYEQLKIDRDKYEKGTTLNKVLKLAGNGAFGNSDNAYSCFYDPRMPKQITVNGQLQILQLAEMFSLIPGVQLIQANTDGITAYVPREVEHFFDLWMKVWEQETKLALEKVEYKSMWIRDVNNYLCVTTKGKIKRKGAYWYPEKIEDYDGVWNKDFSMMIVQKIIGEVLINDWNPEVLIRLSTNPFDFMLRYKTTGKDQVFIGDQRMQKTVRYYVSKSGAPMKKVSPVRGPAGFHKKKNGVSDAEYMKVMDEINAWNAGGQWDRNSWDARIHTKNKSRYEEVTTSIESRWLVKECNDAKNFNWDDLNYDYYLQEIKKLQIG